MTRSCPKHPNETAEALYLGRLSPADAQAFEAHMHVCPLCAAIYARNAEFIDALRTAVQENKTSAAKTN